MVSMADSMGEIEHNPSDLGIKTSTEFDLFPPTKKESEIVTDVLNYHGKTIMLFQMEHTEIHDANTGESLSVPTNWPDKLNEVVNKGDKVFLQYFPPELKRLIQMPIVGPFVGVWTQESGIDIFADMAELANQKGADIFVADTASTLGYAYQELAIDRTR